MPKVTPGLTARLYARAAIPLSSILACVRALAIEMSAHQASDTNLSEGQRVNAVLGSDLHADGAAALGIPCSLSTDLNGLVDLVVVARGEDAEVVGGSDGSVVHAVLVANGGGVPGDSGFLDIVTSFTTDDEALVANDSVYGGGRALEEVGESAEVERGLLEVEVEFGTGGLGVGLEGGQSLGLEALGDVVVELELGVEHVEGGPAEGTGDACARICHQRLYGGG